MVTLKIEPQYDVVSPNEVHEALIVIDGPDPDDGPDPGDGSSPEEKDPLRDLVHDPSVVIIGANNKSADPLIE